MSLEQLQDEKLSVQKTLLQYESTFGRPVSLLCVYIYSYGSLWLCSCLLVYLLTV